MIRFGRRSILGPGEMWPAGDPAYRVSFPRLASGIRIRVVERGNPLAPPIVLVHGWGCTAYVFRYNMPALADAGYRVVALDLKGHGLSDKPAGSGDYTIDALVDHLREALDALGLERPVVVAGHSLGGTLAYHFAARHRERVGGLGLLSPAGLTGVPLMGLYRFLTPTALNPVFKRARSRTVVKIALRRVYGKRGHFSQRDVEEYVAPSQFADYAPAIRQLLHSYDWKAAAHGQLSVVNVPAIGMWGTRDHMMPDNGMDIYKGLVPRIELSSVPDAGHIITEETPNEVNEMLLELLHRVYSGQ
ncbi:MAG TPA: alpha/beta hydrolase [Gemmatimonadaceae bacterium]|jgi:pimeloyl-ACP methyl ester carboxylesterase|nr:alpha/beta hydrolase [Gemmatimonadaceae bacterium]